MSKQTMEVRGQTFEVELDVSRDGTRAEFIARLNERAIGAESWEELRRKLMAETKKAAKRLNVRFSHSLRNGTVTGVHAGTGNLLVTWDDGTKEQIHMLYDAQSALSSEDRAEGLRLLNAKKEADAAVRAFYAARKIDLRRTIEGALAATPDPD